MEMARPGTPVARRYTGTDSRPVWIERFPCRMYMQAMGICQGLREWFVNPPEEDLPKKPPRNFLQTLVRAEIQGLPLRAALVHGDALTARVFEALRMISSNTPALSAPHDPPSTTEVTPSPTRAEGGSFGSYK